MSEFTPEARRMAADVAARHGLGEDAVQALLRALVAGGGGMAQFSHPDLGGMGQWSQGGMIMIGDMFNHGLKARVDAACSDLAGMMRQMPVFAAGRGASPFGEWWPQGLGRPSTAGGQNDLRYAFFPDTHRLAIDEAGRISVYDTGDHRISGVSQQQGAGQRLAFTSQHGDVRLADLPRLGDEAAASAEPREIAAPATAEPAALATAQPAAPAIAEPAARQHAETAPATPEPATRPSAPASHDALFAAIERLADLHAKGILTQEEFTAKKTELLGRL